jgi:DHA2 family multidrug resistance protein
LQTFLERGEIEDWFETGYIIWLGVIAFLGIYLFIWWELTVKDPIVDLKVLKTRNLAIAAALTFVSGIGMFSSVFLTPVYAQRLLGFTPTQTGLLLLPGAILAIIGLIVSARLLQRGLSPLILIGGGLVLFSLFTWQMARLNLQASGSNISAALIWRGIGLAIITVPLTSLAVSSLNAKDIPQGAALNNMMRQLGGSVGLAIVNTFMATRGAVHRSDLVTHAAAYNSLTVQRLSGYTNYFLSKGSTGYQATQQGLQLLDHNIAKQSALLSFMDAYLLIGAIFILAVPLLFFAAKKKRGTVVTVMLSDH